MYVSIYIHIYICTYLHICIYMYMYIFLCDRSLLMFGGSQLTCDRSILICDRSLLTCDRSLLMFDGSRLTHCTCLHLLMLWQQKLIIFFEVDQVSFDICVIYFFWFMIRLFWHAERLFSGLIGLLTCDASFWMAYHRSLLTCDTSLLTYDTSFLDSVDLWCAFFDVFDWFCIYFSISNRRVALPDALFARIFLDLKSQRTKSLLVTTHSWHVIGLFWHVIRLFRQ